MEKSKKRLHLNLFIYKGRTCYNLSFGDWDEKEKRIDDMAISNNNDRSKILETVGSTVLKFMNHFPGKPVYAKGSTAARTRLYQIGIAMNWHEIRKVITVYGYSKNNGWKPFCRGINYEEFMAFSKK